MDNTTQPPGLDRVLQLGEQAADTVLTNPAAEVEADMQRLATFILAHLNSAPGREGTYRQALVALLSVAKDTMIRAATHARHGHLKGLVADAPPLPRVVRFNQRRSEKPGPAAPTLLGALPIRGRGLVETTPSWRAYAHEQLLSRLSRVRFMADLDPDEPADAPAPAAAPAPAVVESKPVPETTTVPHWDADLRELSIRGKVVKSFLQQRAPNQVAVLADFQEKGWPKGINAPLDKDQIGDTVRGLNKWAKDAGLTFRRDGTVQRILWKLL